MASAPGCAFAALMASRNEQCTELHMPSSVSSLALTTNGVTTGVPPGVIVRVRVGVDDPFTTEVAVGVNGGGPVGVAVDVAFPVAVRVAVAVLVGVGFAATLAARQKPPPNANPPPLSVPASGCPIVPPNV